MIYTAQTAIVSGDKLYRYHLYREWDRRRAGICWVMLNPSTADALVDDATIRKIVGFSDRWGYGSMHVVNVFGLRARNPRKLIDAPDAIGPENATAIEHTIQRVATVIAAWGAGVPLSMQDHARSVGHQIREHDGCHVLGVTQDGWPRHPLYMRNDVTPTLWRTLIEAGSKG